MGDADSTLFRLGSLGFVRQIGTPLVPQAVPQQTPKRRKPPRYQGFPALACYGRYWARTSDLRLVEAALSQLS